MPRTLVIHAHPRPSQSLVIKAMQAVFEGDAHTEIRSLYDRYPDFDIHVSSEQQALARADLVVWLAPIHWYSVPALLKHWFDQVLAHGWAFGPVNDQSVLRVFQPLHISIHHVVPASGLTLSCFAFLFAFQRPNVPPIQRPKSRNPS